MKDKYMQKVVVGHLASIGGSSIDNMASRILKYMINNGLAEKYNWTGVNKSAFRDLTIPSLLKRAIKTTFRLVSMAEIESCIKSFLKSAKDRDGGRQRRMKIRNMSVNTCNREEVQSGSDSDDM